MLVLSKNSYENMAEPQSACAIRIYKQDDSWADLLGFVCEEYSLILLLTYRNHVLNPL